MSPPAPASPGGRLVPVVCGSMILWAGLMTAAFVGLARLLAIGGVRQDVDLSNDLLPIVPLSLLVVLLYLIWRLLPIRRVLQALQRGEKPDPAELGDAARQAMMMPPFFLVGAMLVSVAVSVSMFIAGALVEVPGVNVVARLLSVGQALIIVYGMGCYLLLRSRLRPVLVKMMPHAVPSAARFGLRRRLTLWVLLLSAVGLMAVLVIDSQATGRLLNETAGAQPGTMEAAEWPLLTGSALVAIVLVLFFAAASGWQLGLATRGPALGLRRHLERMAAMEGGAVVERLPIYSSTEVGRIAVAFNRLADRLDIEHARLDAYARQIEQTERLRSRFLANVSHELRTPLNAIIGFSDVLLQGFDGELNQRQRDAVRIVCREGERFLRLIDDILLMARFEADKVILLEQDLGFSEVVEEALRSASIPDADLLVQETAPGLERFHVRGDRKQLVRAVSALVEHALGAAGNAKVYLQAEVDCERSVRLRMTCPSVPPPDSRESERLFEGFRKLEGSEWMVAGAGLGLPLARRIARAHGGETEFIHSGGACGLQMRLPAVPGAAEMDR